MYAAVIARDAGDAAFRDVARQCLAAQVPPEQLAFVDPSEPSLLPPPPTAGTEMPPMLIPRSYAALMADAICHRAADRFALLYEVLWRFAHGERAIMTRATDPAIARLNDYAHNVRRDIHKMHAFVRFREHTVEGRLHYTAWFEPQHYILERAAPFFAERFPNMNWLIATPIGTAVWQNGTLSFEPPTARVAGGDDSVLDELWLTYYRTTFNPSRVRVKAMVSEMPKHYWRNMPETELIPGMVAEAGARVAEMDRRMADQPPVFAQRIAARPKPVMSEMRTPLEQLRADAATCQRCPLFGPATQTVFGEGPADARLVFVGEQPGDQEDISGRPFVGPAGELFDRALADAGIVRDAVYVTNAVKHFKYEVRGKRRIHKRPNAGEIRHCRWWLEREVATIDPALIVALGATAAHALTGRTVSVLSARGPAEFSGRAGFVTVHPSFLLRLPDAAHKASEYRKFVDDLHKVRALLAA